VKTIRMKVLFKVQYLSQAFFNLKNYWINDCNSHSGLFCLY
jgi:hypothetical protein